MGGEAGTFPHRRPCLLHLPPHSSARLRSALRLVANIGGRNSSGKLSSVPPPAGAGDAATIEPILIDSDSSTSSYPSFISLCKCPLPFCSPLLMLRASSVLSSLPSAPVVEGLVLGLFVLLLPPSTSSPLGNHPFLVAVVQCCIV